MKALKLYEERPKLAVETAEGLAPDSACSRCALRDRAKKVCHGPRFVDGDPSVGTLLVVVDGVTAEEDRMGQTYRGELGIFVQRLVGKHWKGRVVFDVATRCPAGKDGASEKAVEACRPYLAHTYASAGPTRILVAGGNAALAVFGRATAAFTNRRNYAFTGIKEEDGSERLVPVFSLFHPLQALRNSFLRRWWEEDLKWALTASPELPPWEGTAYVVETPEDAREAMAVITAAPAGAFDVETSGRMFAPAWRMLSLAVAPADDRMQDAYVWTEEALKDPRARAGLLEWLGEEKAQKIGSNGKYDALSCKASFALDVKGLTSDVRLERKLLDPEADGKLDKMASLVGMGGMKEVSSAILKPIYHQVSLAFGRRTRAANSKTKPHVVDLVEDFQERFGVSKAFAAYMADKDNDKESWGYALLPKDILHRYNARDAVSTVRLKKQVIDPQMAHPDAAPLKRTWDRVIRGASQAIVQVEAWGVAADREAILTLQKFLDVREKDLRDQLRGHADINWGSRDQVAEYFFKKLGLPPVSQTKSGLDSTDSEALEELAKLHPSAALLMDLRSVDKLNGTYARGLLPHIRSDGRIHPSFLLDGARSGRTSCQNPNLQNQPRPDSAEAKMVRDIFIAPRGKRLVQLDYSQLELRVACMLSGDEEMLKIFLEGVDYHQRTAELISFIAWGIPPEQVEKKHRSFAKTINFGLLYGKGDKTIAEEFGCSVAEAAKIRAAILGKFKKLAAWCREREQEARLTGEVWTTWDGERARRRPLWRIGDADDFVRSVALHGAVNSPVQGSANEYGVASLTGCVNWLVEDAVPAKLVLFVHDSLMFEVDDDAVDEVIYQGRRIMTQWDTKGVPLVADVETGPSWGSLLKLKEAA